MKSLVAHQFSKQSDPKVILLVDIFIEKHNPKLAEKVREHIGMKRYLDIIQNPEKWNPKPDKTSHKDFIKENSYDDPEVLRDIAKYMVTEKHDEIPKIINNIARNHPEKAEQLNNMVIKALREQYGYSQVNASKKHSHEVNSNSLTSQKEFKKRSGDDLKTYLLLEFKTLISKASEDANSPEDFDKRIQDIKKSKSSELQKLGEGQDKTTRILGLKTTSVKILNDMVKDARTEVVQKTSKSSFRQ